MPEGQRKTLMAIFLILIGAVAAVVGFTWWLAQGPAEPGRYSKYGFSFEYPKGMQLDNITASSSSSGMVIGELLSDTDVIEIINVGWSTRASTPNLQILLNESFLSLEAEGLEVKKEQLVNSTEVCGHEAIYQSFTGTIVEALTFYGISGVWYCDRDSRSFEFIVMHSEQDVLSRYHQYIDSFVCH